MQNKKLFFKMVDKIDKLLFKSEENFKTEVKMKVV